MNSAESSITAADLARRYGLTLVKAHRWLRELPHWNVGRTRFTSDAMLAGWLAANVKNPPRVESFDPLQDAVVNQAIGLIQRLVQEGRIAVLPLLAGSNGRELDRPAHVVSMNCIEPASVKIREIRVS